MSRHVQLLRSGITIACVLSLFLLWAKFSPLFLSTYGFGSHGDCYLWNQGLVTLFAGSDSLIGLSYLFISGTLVYFVYKTHRDLPFPWVFIAFGIFIIACGSTHFLDVWTIWVPVYVLSGMLRFVTAIASITTAVLLPLVLPGVYSLISEANLSKERKLQLEQANRELENQYERDFRQLTNAMPQIVWTSRPDGWLDYYNQRWFDYTGLTLEQTQGWGWELVLHPDDFQRCVDLWTHSVQTGEFYEIEYRYKRASDGSYRWHLGRAQPTRDADGHIVKWFGSSTDIDDQKQIEAALRESEHDFRVLADAIPQKVWVIGSNGDKEFCSQRWCDYIGMTMEQALKNDWANIIHPDDWQGCADQWHVSLTSDNSYEAEMRLRRAEDGVYLWHLTRAVPVTNAQGTLTKWFGTYTDIDHQKQTEVALRESERRKDLFMSMVSHELKTPLASLQLFAEVLHEDLDASGQHSLVVPLIQMETQMLRMQKLIAELLDLSRVQMGKLALTKTWVDMGAFLQEIVSIIQPSHPHHLIIVSGSPHQQIYADKDRLSQVLINLLSNAIKYSPPGAPVEVSVAADQQMVTTTIRDEGIGIPKEHLAHIFERFYRVYNDRDSKFPGLGIGLYISAEIIQRHHGRIWVESTEGNGSTFRFSLPFSHEDAEEEDQNEL